jgi:Ser-tRNA(Ala) deacylase AlaX
MYLLGYSPKTLSPIKADHGKKPFIVYQGLLDKDIKQELEDKAQELVEKNLKFSWNFQPLESLQKEALYLQPNLPTNKPLRTFRLEGVGAVADGGTQLHTTKEAGRIVIEDIVIEEGNTIVKYSVQD